jgi:hypothetical protein
MAIASTLAAQVEPEIESSQSSTEPEPPQLDLVVGRVSRDNSPSRSADDSATPAVPVAQVVAAAAAPTTVRGDCESSLELDLMELINWPEE